MKPRTARSTTGGDVGFTLIELLVVMIIIGILAAIAIPVFLSQKKKAGDTAIRSDLRNTAAVIEANADDGSYLPNLNGDFYDGLNQTGYRNFPNTPGVHVWYHLKSSDAYCLRGWGDSGKATAIGGGSGYFYYVSDAGGLQSGPALTTPPAGC